jgi:hypothetical protein
MTVSVTRTAAVIAAVCLASACAKTPVVGSAAPAAGAPAGTVAPGSAPPGGSNFQLVSIPGSRSVTGGFLRINTATGQTVSGWNNQSVLTAVLDVSPPPGKYQLYFWTQPADADGSVSWNAVRMEKNSGRIWNLNGTNAPFSWGEVAGPNP